MVALPDRRAVLAGILSAPALRLPAGHAGALRPPPPFVWAPTPKAVVLGRVNVDLNWPAPPDAPRVGPCPLQELFDRPEPAFVLGPGLYEPGFLAGRKRLIAPAGVVIRSPGPSVHERRFRRADGLWTARLAERYDRAPHRLLWTTRFDPAGYEVRLRRWATVAELRKARAGWHYADGVLTVAEHPKDVRAIFTDIGGLSRIRVEGGALTIEGDATLDGVGIEALRSTVALRGVTIQHPAGNGLRMEAGRSQCEDVRIYAA